MRDGDGIWDKLEAVNHINHQSRALNPTLAAGFMQVFLLRLVPPEGLGLEATGLVQTMLHSLPCYVMAG